MQETLCSQLENVLFPLLCLHGTRSNLQRLLHWLKSLSMKQKKELITLSRSCSIPPRGTNLYQRTHSLLDAIPTDLTDYLSSLVCDNTTSGLLISLCISMPISSKLAKQQFSDMLSKEMKVMESSPLPSTLNYDCFFVDPKRPLHPHIAPNPKMASAVQRMIDNWIEHLKKSTIYPHMTKKLCSKTTQDLVLLKYPEYMTFEPEGATQCDLEYLYHVYGDLLEGGPCQIKQRWYTSGLAPRTYYAAGSDAYHKSKYLRVAFNDLCDFLPPTERYARVNPSRLFLPSEDHHVLIYDLTSFTSNMHEQRHFLDRLARYCLGHQVMIMDTVEGVVPVDLGELIFEYNTLNCQHTYSSDQLLGESVVLAHHVAGFLGVFGNLATCTFLHGAVMSQLVDEFSEIGIAGDDGAIVSIDDEYAVSAIRLLGLMEYSKVYSTLDPGRQLYLKRPIFQVGRRLYTESLALFSMLEHLGDCDDSRFFPVTRSKKERLSSLASSVVAYLRSLSRLTLSTHQIRCICSFLCGIYAMVGFPTCGYLPQIASEVQTTHPNLPQTLIPTIDEAFIGMNPIEITIKSTYSGVAVLPEIVSERIEYDDWHLFAGSEFDATMSSSLVLLSRLGYLELESRDVVYTGEEGLLRALDYMTSPGNLVKYTVTVLKDIPDLLIS